MTILSFQLISDTTQALTAQYQPTMLRLAEEVGLPRPWGMLWITQEFEPEVTTFEMMRAFAPFTAPQALRERLGILVDAGLMSLEDETIYRLTTTGREKLNNVIERLVSFVSGMDVMPTQKVERLSDYLETLVETAMAGSEPVNKTNLLRNRKSAPIMQGSAMIRILQCFTDLGAFRDDCHNATWEHYGIPGYEWEALSFIWLKDANSPAAIQEKLPNRAYEESDYAQACERLAARGWIEAADGDFRTTSTGERVRQQAEDETERLYAKAWGTLNTDEQHQLADLLVELETALKATASA